MEKTDYISPRMQLIELLQSESILITSPGGNGGGELPGNPNYNI